MGALDCRPGRTHAFDELSGWCNHNCGVRDDGRVVNRLTGEVILPGPTYTFAQLKVLQDSATAVLQARVDDDGQ